MNIDWTNIVILVAITIAITNRIKSELPELRSFWYTLISLGVGTALIFYWCICTGSSNDTAYHRFSGFGNL